MVNVDPHAKNQGQRSNGSNKRVPTANGHTRTNRRTRTNMDATKSIISPATRSIIRTYKTEFKHTAKSLFSNPAFSYGINPCWNKSHKVEPSLPPPSILNQPFLCKPVLIFHQSWFGVSWCLTSLFSTNIWLYQGQKVRGGELPLPSIGRPAIY